MLASFALWFIVTIWSVIRSPVVPQVSPLIINDISQLNPIHVNRVITNISIRHAKQDPGSLLAWAPTEVFAFVIYYKQETSDAARNQVGVWTRELIDAALDVGGSYYLPYQLHASREQFLRAYPRADEFLALKQRLDPTNKFRNELLDKYLHH